MKTELEINFDFKRTQLYAYLQRLFSHTEKEKYLSFDVSVTLEGFCLTNPEKQNPEFVIITFEGDFITVLFDGSRESWSPRGSSDFRQALFNAKLELYEKMNCRATDLLSEVEL